MEQQHIFDLYNEMIQQDYKHNKKRFQNLTQNKASTGFNAKKAYQSKRADSEKQVSF